ncbi:hypothetical protein HNR31_002221 [Anoxybacillus caldiproteolyticus]|uniref:Uncharacterized protein n=1 Tax=Thermaerobacillus caldiproteolyticus TaxID=247480 RepID=A0A7V9Z7F8_9BACL|nr:hypothetical protein [Anoxybacillus caldiproteolyticus]
MTKVIGGERKIQDPDNLIYDIDWKSAEEIKKLELPYSEDREFLINDIQRNLK